MLDILKTWNGQITVNDITYNSVNDIIALPNTPLHIILGKNIDGGVKNPVKSLTDKQNYQFTVKGYMCKKSTPEFDFMLKFNNDNPMPMRIMVGTIEKETKGMVYLNLHGEGLPTITCMRCGRELTNPISRHYGLGIECINKVGIPFTVDMADEEKIKNALVNITWEGWCPKSAIIDKTSIE